MNKHVKETCKIGQEHECCRYLILGSSGFECAKLTYMKINLDIRAELKRMVARGDNCEGGKDLTLNE